MDSDLDRREEVRPVGAGGQGLQGSAGEPERRFFQEAAEIIQGVDGPQERPRTPEEEARDVLEQADGLEPEYEFESVEGVVSPEGGAPDCRDDSVADHQQERGERQVFADNPRLTAGAVPGEERLNGAVPGQMRDQFQMPLIYGEEAQQRAWGERQGFADNPLRHAGAAPGEAQLNGTLPGPTMKPSYRPEVFGALHRGRFLPSDGEQLHGRVGVDAGLGGNITAGDRTLMLEQLIYQLMDQNEALRREVGDTASRSSAECDRHVREGLRNVAFEDVSRHSRESGVDWSTLEQRRPLVTEGRGYGALGGRPKLGKGIGGQGSKDHHAEHSRVFRPPWTTFQPSQDVVMSSMAPGDGPGDRLLQATRALQAFTVESDDAEWVKRSHPSWQDVEGPVQGSRPMDVDPPSNLNPKNPNPDVCPTVTAGAVQDPYPKDPNPSRSAAVPESAGPGLDNVQGLIGKKVQVWINGVLREGVYDQSGSVVLTPEVPKFYSMDDVGQGTEEQLVPKPPYGPPPDSPDRGRDARGPWSSQAKSPFRAIADSPPPPPPAQTGRNPSHSPYGRLRQARSPSRSPGGHPCRFKNNRTVQGSPATPGGTRVPKGAPPVTPPVAECVPDHSLSSLSIVPGPQNASQGGMGVSLKDFIPGERTLWELPKLGPVGEACPAMRCNDWLHKIKSSYNRAFHELL